MSEPAPRPHGLFGSIRGLLQGGVALLHNRIELFATELEEQRVRVVRLLLLSAVTVFLFNSALLVVTALIVFVVGPGARLPVLAALAFLYSGSTLGAFLLLRRELRSAPPPFRDTIGELKKDTACLEPPP